MRRAWGCPISFSVSDSWSFIRYGKEKSTGGATVKDLSLNSSQVAKVWGEKTEGGTKWPNGGEENSDGHVGETREVQAYSTTSDTSCSSAMVRRSI